MSGRKTIEVRSWLTRIRGRVLIHAARIPDERPEAWNWVTDKTRPLTLPVGGIIGEAVLDNCIRYSTQAEFNDHGSKHLNDASWYREGLYGFIFQKAIMLPFRRFSGNVRFFHVEEE
ncbi:MAG: ASCH domain-containing protein [Planctomycetes bacterium]|nr:ASCH domain-containing protein [Planctomycetota bacterium]